MYSIQMINTEGREENTELVFKVSDLLLNGFFFLKAKLENDLPVERKHDFEYL